jgi:hypothetical protein
MHFREVAQQAFSFLEREGFRLAKSDATRLQYESGQAVVVIGWDARSGELEAWFGLQPKSNIRPELFSLSDLLTMEGVKRAHGRTPFQVAQEDRLPPFLKILAEDTRMHAQPALAGDRMFFRRLETFRSARAEAFMREMELTRARAEANEAWRSRDLSSLIRVYTAIESDLSEAEKGRLDYARKHTKA